MSADVKKKTGGDTLVFDTFPQQEDIQFSKDMATPKGNKVKVLQTSNRNVALSIVGQIGKHSITVTDDSGTVTPTVMANIWDAVTDFVLDLILNRIDSGTCTSETTITTIVHPDGTTSSSTIVKRTCTQ